MKNEKSAENAAKNNTKISTKNQLSLNSIRNKVYIIRGVQVMLDFDLAEIYGYEVKRLNEQVSRNISRFPSDFMFRLSSDEVEFLKSQIATAKNDKKKDKRGGRQNAPYAFTEQGVYMLATVLKGEVAVISDISCRSR